jgi:hypothetical protein
MLTAPENERMVLNKEAAELQLMEQTLEAYLEKLYAAIQQEEEERNGGAGAEWSVG